MPHEFEREEAAEPSKPDVAPQRTPSLEWASAAGSAAVQRAARSAGVPRGVAPSPVLARHAAEGEHDHAEAGEAPEEAAHTEEPED